MRIVALTICILHLGAAVTLAKPKISRTLISETIEVPVSVVVNDPESGPATYHGALIYERPRRLISFLTAFGAMTVFLMGLTAFMPDNLTPTVTQIMGQTAAVFVPSVIWGLVTEFFFIGKRFNPYPRFQADTPTRKHGDIVSAALPNHSSKETEELFKDILRANRIRLKNDPQRGDWHLSELILEVSSLGQRGYYGGDAYQIDSIRSALRPAKENPETVPKTTGLHKLRPKTLNECFWGFLKRKN